MSAHHFTGACCMGLLAAVLLFVFTPDALAQTGTITGQVLDAGTERPLPGAAVLIAGTTQGAATDTDGRFTIQAVSPGTKVLETRLLSYEIGRDTVQVRAGQTTQLTILLSVEAVGMDMVIVEGETEAERTERTAQAVQVLDLREARVEAADLGLVLARTEGVSVQRAGGLGSGTRFSLNGLTDDQVRFFLNGLPLDLTGFPFGIANVPTTLIDRVEVYKGVVPIRFGADALGGAVNLVTSDGLDGLGGSVSYQTGSFGTHRTSLDTGYRDPSTGLFVRGGGFYDFARNDYDVTVFIADRLGQRTEETVPRFNDRYRAGSVNLTAGIRGRSWAEELSVTGFAVDFARQIQNNATMSGLPFGEAESFGTTYGASATYRVSVADQVSFDVVGGYTYSERRLLDVANCRYNWFGDCIIEVQDPGEIVRNRGTDRTIFDDDAFARIGAEWRVAPQHTIRLTTAPTINWRTGRDALIVRGTDILAGDARLTTWVSGAEYQFDLPNGRFENRLFVKDYRRVSTSAFGTASTNLRDAAPSTRTTAELLGFGNVARIEWTDRFATKVSYEWATRLPRRDELFGNGVGIGPNTDLLPERSHNANIELSLSSARGARTSWSVQTNGFLRITDNLITLVPENEFFDVFNNVFGATSLGIEASGRATLLDDRLTIDANTTYQEFTNTATEGFFSLFEGDRIPNRPYFFMNGAARYRLDSPVLGDGQLNLFTSTRYVHGFFRTWESAGRRQLEFKAEIPTQTTVAAGATYEYTTAGVRWALTGEIQNLTNATVFDFFGVQRPGRAFYIKLTSQL
ncbi:MAG: carboxypeptidase-like regulatory domain-containing protein [Bacteroidota bacterium]